MRVLSKFMAIALAATVIITPSNIASAQELTYASSTNNEALSEENTLNASSEADNVQLRTSRAVYTDIPLTIYTGTGTERWVHLVVQSQPGVPIRLWMEGYNGGLLYEDYIRGAGTTHWYVGSNVKYVKIQGGPSAVNYSNSEH